MADDHEAAGSQNGPVKTFFDPPEDSRRRLLERSHRHGRDGLREETFPNRATEHWIGLSALDYSLVMKPGARAPGWYKAGPLARKATG